jgi:hypothetical protein
VPPEDGKDPGPSHNLQSPIAALQLGLSPPGGPCSPSGAAVDQCQMYKLQESGAAHGKQAEQGDAGAQLRDAVAEEGDDLPQVAPLPPRLPCSKAKPGRCLQLPAWGMHGPAQLLQVHTVKVAQNSV